MTLSRAHKHLFFTPILTLIHVGRKCCQAKPWSDWMESCRVQLTLLTVHDDDDD